MAQKRLDPKQVLEVLRTDQATVADLAQKFGCNKATVTRAIVQIRSTNPDIGVVGKRETQKRGRPQMLFGVLAQPRPLVETLDVVPTTSTEGI